MAVEDVQFLNLFKGKRIKLTLKTSSYLGVVQRINPNKTLVLADVVSGNNGCKYPGSKLFFGHEILNVEFTSETDPDRGNIHDYKLEDHLNVDKFQPYRKTITLGDDEADEEYVNFVVIDEFHEKFGPAVIHDCRAIAGCLIAQFGVKLTNVFDTQVADVMCFYSETGGFLPNRVSTLQEVVSLYLKVPPSQLVSLQMKSQLTEEERELWQKRPCPVPLLKVMALSVIHLLPLRLVLMDTLMLDYVALVDSYLSSSHYEPDELEHVSMECMLQLPRELRKLEQMRCERQEWAADHYPVTEQGLLARFNPTTHSPPPEAQELCQTQADSTETTTVESPPSIQVDLPLHNPITSPQRVTNVSSVDVRVSSDPAPQAPVPSDMPGLTEKMCVFSSLGTPGVGRGRTEALMDTMGRGKPFGKEQSSVPALPTIGRGFLLRISQVHMSRESTGDLETSSGRMSQSYTDPRCDAPAWPQC